MSYFTFFRKLPLNRHFPYTRLNSIATAPYCHKLSSRSQDFKGFWSFAAGALIYLPIAHGQGKVFTKDEATLDELKSGGYVAFKYAGAHGQEGDYPIDPSGYTDSIAALTDSTGRVLGLMPHPERFARPTHHPHWPRLKEKNRRQPTRRNDNLQQSRKTHPPKLAEQSPATLILPMRPAASIQAFDKVRRANLKE
jgi:hypothetical protein